MVELLLLASPRRTLTAVRGRSAAGPSHSRSCRPPSTEFAFWGKAEVSRLRYMSPNNADQLLIITIPGRKSEEVHGVDPLTPIPSSQELARRRHARGLISVSF